MKATHVPIIPTPGVTQQGLTPELLAAVGARYSRSDEGLEAILAKVEGIDPDKAVDDIFKFVDYGHQSIADMVPVSIFIDGISIFLAYYIFSKCPLAVGQETSTRYVKMQSPGNLLDRAVALGIPEEDRGVWANITANCYEQYQEVLTFWEQLSGQFPEVVKLPTELVASTNPKDKQKVARMRRNYAFDRARYFLPVSAETNMMLIQSARCWVQLIQQLASTSWAEAQMLAIKLINQLALVAPRLIKHAGVSPSYQAGFESEFMYLSCDGASVGENGYADPEELTAESFPHLDIAEGALPDSIVSDALRYHDNRYSYLGEGLRDEAIRFGWSAVAFAEIRDLNRHRTGNKYCPLNPLGFYFAEDQIPLGCLDNPKYHLPLRERSDFGYELSKAARKRLAEGKEDYIYWTLLGTQYRFSHLTTVDKFIYEAELRTGTGAHFRYAKHFHDVLELWFQRFPDTRGQLLIGNAEPE